MDERVTPSSAARKFARGVDQVKVLLSEVEEYEDREAFAFTNESEELAPNEIRLRCFATERENQPEHWPLLAGEAIQNLRSSLDHMVYAASGGRERTQFPIFETAGEFNARSASMLDGVPEATKTTIERLQPYRDTPENPAADRLVLLRRLSNADKHRVLATVADAVQSEAVGVGTGVEGRWEEYATGKALGPGRQQISVFRAVGEGPIRPDQLQPMFDYQVLIEGYPIPFLKGIVHRIFPILAECETGEPLSPFAAYPL